MERKTVPGCPLSTFSCPCLPALPPPAPGGPRRLLGLQRGSSFPIRTHILSPDGWVSVPTVSSPRSGPSAVFVRWPPGGRRQLRAQRRSGLGPGLSQVGPHCPWAWGSLDTCGSRDCACRGPLGRSVWHAVGAPEPGGVNGPGRAAAQARGEDSGPRSAPGSHLWDLLWSRETRCSVAGNSPCRALPLRPAAQGPRTSPQPLPGGIL